MLRTPFWKRQLVVAVLASFGALVPSACGDDGPSGPGSTSLPDLFGDLLYRADGTTVGVETLQNRVLIGVYFASPTCPACAGFSPILLEAYGQLKEDGRSFEVVLVSPGISDLALLDYMAETEMGWLAVSSQSKQANALVQRYNVRWIPTLVVMDPEGGTVSLNGREEVTLYGAGAYDQWLAARAGG